MQKKVIEYKCVYGDHSAGLTHAVSNLINSDVKHNCHWEPSGGVALTTDEATGIVVLYQAMVLVRCSKV